MLKKFRQIFYEQMTQGASPKSLALGCSIAFVLSVFPVFGVTTLLCFLVGTRLKLNQPIMQGVNYLLAPVHLLLMPVFFKLGQAMFGPSNLALDFSNIHTEFISNWSASLSKYGLLVGQMILAWFITAPLVGLLLYFLLQPVFSRYRFSLPKVDSSKL